MTTTQRLPLRLIDGGIADGRWQVAAGAALIAEHAADQTPDTLRIFRTRETVFIGRHQAIWDTVAMEDCLADGIAIARRITGGGAVHVDGGVIGWEATLRRERLTAQALGPAILEVAQAARAGLSRAFGVDAFPVGAVSGLIEGHTLATQGFLRFSAPRADQVAYITQGDLRDARHNFPAATPEIVDLLAGLADGLAQAYDLVPEAGEMTTAEAARTQRLHEDDIGTDEFVFAIDDPLETGLRVASHKTAECQTTVYLKTGWNDGVHVISEALITGDFLISPARRLSDLERAIQGLPVTEVAGAIDRFFGGMDLDLALITPADLKAVILAGLAATPQRDLLPIR